MHGNCLRLAEKAGEPKLRDYTLVPKFRDYALAFLSFIEIEEKDQADRFTTIWARVSEPADVPQSDSLIGQIFFRAEGT